MGFAFGCYGNQESDAAEIEGPAAGLETDGDGSTKVVGLSTWRKFHPFGGSVVTILFAHSLVEIAAVEGRAVGSVDGCTCGDGVGGYWSG